MQFSKERLLEDILQDVPFEGWSELALEKAAKNQHIDKTLLSIYLPHGITDVVELFFNKLNQEIYLALQQQRDFHSQRIRDRIKTAIKLRLEHYEPYKAAIKQLVVFYSLPHRLPYAMSAIWHLADEIWYMAGDQSTDYNYYTKRAILSAVYTSTFLYWLEDSSTDHENTWSFLERRIDDVMKIEKMKKSLGHFPAGLSKLPFIGHLLGRK